MIELNKEDDARLEELAKQHGMRWDGDRWVIEDADLHPFMRAILSAKKQDDCKFPLCQTEQYQRDMAAAIHRELYSGQPADELTCEDIERLKLALSWEGYSTPESLESCAARWPSLVRNLISAVLDRKKRRQDAAYDKERERAAFEKHYAQEWQKFSENAAAHSIEFLCSELKAMRRGGEYGKDQSYLNFMWEGWQAKAESAGQA